MRADPKLVVPDSSQLTEVAFMRPPEAEVNASEIKSIYGGDVPYYALDNLFDRQMVMLIARLRQLCMQLEVSTLAFEIDADWFDDLLGERDHLRRFQDNISNPMIREEYFLGQSSEFFIEIKQNIEKICLQLQNSSISIQKKKAVLQHLLPQLNVCGPGIFASIEEALWQLSSKQTIAHWLCDQRRLIVRNMAENFIAQRRISNGDSIHVHTVFIKFGEDQGWGLGENDPSKGLFDFFAHLSRIKESDLLQLKRDFFIRYSATSILETLIDQLLVSILDAGLRNVSKDVNGWWVLTPESFNQFYAHVSEIELLNVIGFEQVFAYEANETKIRLQLNIKSDLYNAVLIGLLRAGYFKHSMPLVLDIHPDTQEEIMIFDLMMNHQCFYGMMQDRQIYSLYDAFETNELYRHFAPLDSFIENFSPLRFPLGDFGFQYCYEGGEKQQPIRDFQHFDLTKVCVKKLIDANDADLSASQLLPEQKIALFQAKHPSFLTLDLESIAIDACKMGDGKILSLAIELDPTLLRRVPFWAIALNFGQVHLVDLFKERKEIDVNMLFEGKTALYLAIRSQQIAEVEKLLAHKLINPLYVGLDLSRTSFVMAIESRHEGILNRMLRATLNFIITHSGQAREIFDRYPILQERLSECRLQFWQMLRDHYTDWFQLERNHVAQILEGILTASNDPNEQHVLKRIFPTDSWSKRVRFFVTRQQSLHGQMQQYLETITERNVSTFS